MSKTYRKRDPKPQHRDPEIEPDQPQKRKPRRYIPANAPTVCPDCGHNTRMDDGRHVDQVRRRILEYRTCAGCAALLVAGRDMTPVEVQKLCTRADAMAEYESIVRVSDNKP